MIPVKLNPTSEASTENKIPEYRMYEELLKSSEVLAVFNLNNYCICVLYKDRLIQVGISKEKPPADLVMWNFKEDIKVPNVTHVGFIATKQDCLAVTEAPHHLTVDENGILSDGFGKLEFNAMHNPPYSLYKELVRNRADAVLYDVDQQRPVFINKRS